MIDNAFSELKYADEPVRSWAFVEVPSHYEPTRIYYKPYSEHLGPGFWFVVVSIVSHSLDGEPFDDNCGFETVVFGRAQFDGIRHAWFGPRDPDLDRPEQIDGYLFYPDTRMLSAVFAELRKLEEHFCSDLE